MSLRGREQRSRTEIGARSAGQTSSAPKSFWVAKYASAKTSKASPRSWCVSNEARRASSSAKFPSLSKSPRATRWRARGCLGPFVPHLLNFSGELVSGGPVRRLDAICNRPFFVSGNPVPASDIVYSTSENAQGRRDRAGWPSDDSEAAAIACRVLPTVLSRNPGRLAGQRIFSAKRTSLVRSLMSANDPKRT